jgi:hypothetical protein
MGGAVGLGLSRNVRDAYAFVAANYCDGDEIFLFGFSRGAYTVRSVAGIIGWTGLIHMATWTISHSCGRGIVLDLTPSRQTFGRIFQTVMLAYQ